MKIVSANHVQKFFPLVPLMILVSCVALPSRSMLPLTQLTSPPKICATKPNSVTCQLLTGEPKFVKTPNAEIAYQVFGHGKPLVLIHGWPLNRYTWRSLLPYLVEHFTVYLFDVPGGGDTVWTEKTDFTWPGQGASMKVAVRELGLDHYYLFAQDSGAVIARELALIDGEHIIKFAMANTEIPEQRPPQSLVDAQAKMSMHPHGLIRWILRRKFNDPEFLQSADGFGESFSDPAFVLDDFREYVLQPIVKDSIRTEGHRRFLEGWDWKELDSLKARHQQIKMPILFIWGEDDKTFPVEQAEVMKKQFPNCQGLIRIPKAKLLVHEERAELVAAQLIKFFR